jgi:hypothetical protein
MKVRNPFKPKPKSFKDMTMTSNLKDQVWATPPEDINSAINTRAKVGAGSALMSRWNKKLRERLGKSELVKSPYGPSGMGLYNPNDNARRKMTRTTEVVQIGPNKAVQTTKVGYKQQADQLAREAKAKSKKNPVKRYTQAEINNLMRQRFSKKSV